MSVSIWLFEITRNQLDQIHQTITDPESVNSKLHDHGSTTVGPLNYWLPHHPGRLGRKQIKHSQAEDANSFLFCLITFSDQEVSTN